MAAKLGQKLTDDPKDKQYHFLLNNEESAALEEASKLLGLKRSKVIIQGIKLVLEKAKADSENKKR